MSDFNLRAPSLGDGVAVSRLVRRCRPLDVNSHYLYLLLCHHFAQTCAVAEGDGEVLGFVSAYRPPQQLDTLFVWQVAVAPEGRGRGLASRLLDEVLQRPGCADLRFVEATISPSNAASQALFHSLARRLNTECRVSPLFTAECFSGIEAHEPEELYRIGPFSVSCSIEEKT
jgi:L-2,4-diaminobutyric acid acetyltransferase